MASMAVHTPISDFLSMSLKRFYQVVQAIYSVQEKRRQGAG